MDILVQENVLEDASALRPTRIIQKNGNWLAEHNYNRAKI